jgi:hypothetical protein
MFFRFKTSSFLKLNTSQEFIMILDLMLILRNLFRSEFNYKIEQKWWSPQSEIFIN